MSSSDFHRDDDWQREVRNRLLAPFYGQHSRDSRYVFVDRGKLATILQRRYATDTILQALSGSAICLEEKIVRWPKHGRPYDAFALETMSCTVPGHESPGWMVYGEADYLLYCFAQDPAASRLIAYLIDFPALKEWFWPLESLFPQFGPLETLNRSSGRVVPIDEVVCAVKTRCYEITEPMSITPPRRRAPVNFRRIAHQLELRL